MNKTSSFPPPQTFDLTRDPDDLDDPRTTEEDARAYFRDLLADES